MRIHVDPTDCGNPSESLWFDRGHIETLDSKGPTAEWRKRTASLALLFEIIEALLVCDGNVFQALDGGVKGLRVAGQ
jgi:hypothetical protein